jgi:hypothetical protein
VCQKHSNNYDLFCVEAVIFPVMAKYKVIELMVFSQPELCCVSRLEQRGLKAHDFLIIHRLNVKTYMDHLFYSSLNDT